MIKMKYKDVPLNTPFVEMRMLMFDIFSNIKSILKVMYMIEDKSTMSWYSNNDFSLPCYLFHFDALEEMCVLDMTEIAYLRLTDRLPEDFVEKALTTT